MASPITPRSVALNLVRASAQRPVSIRHLLEAAALFGFNPSAVRVAVTRLTADGLLENDERGSYRLGRAAAATHAHVETWRSGEARMRPWKGEWLTVVLGSKPERSTRRASLRALERLSLRQGLPGLWLRPDNLREPLAATSERLRALGLDDHAELFRTRNLSEPLAQRLCTELWPVRSLERSYGTALRALERSLVELARMPRDKALVQSFLLGGEAIRVLATDPLLPEQILPGQTRAKLTEAMLRYDVVGRALWRGFATAPELALVNGGARAG
ncbi:MAG: hypothetical protein ACHQ53_02965 [Polyangiales bacterium]